MNEERRGDYLWDGSGEPDEWLRSLEELLRPLRYDRPLDTNPPVETGSESEPQDD